MGMSRLVQMRPARFNDTFRIHSPHCLLDSFLLNSIASSQKIANHSLVASFWKLLEYLQNNSV